MLRGALIAVWLTALAAPAVAQPPADPIDAILQGRTLSKDADPEEPDTAATGARVDPEPTLPAPPLRYPPPPRSTLTAPIFLNETDKSPDAPTSADVAYDSRIRASMAAAQGFQGPMDGGWTLSAGSRELYVFQLVDRDGLVEGAWRDPRRAGATNASGFIDAIERSGADVTFRFAGVAATLHPSGDGRWAGKLEAAGKMESVSLRRRNP
jgi:hypothetical protein